MAKKKKLLIGREEYDHPEHFDDVIREYLSSDKYIPTPLEDLLLESSGHRCTICLAPWCEIHHIMPLGKKGKTEWGNLIVLCPNCHTRVHKENFPSRRQLLQYKMKQEIAYGLPIINLLSSKERELIKEVSKLERKAILTFRKSIKMNCVSSDIEKARKEAREYPGFIELELHGIISSEVIDIDIIRNVKKFDVRLRFTPKGIKWITYLSNTNRINL